MGNGVVERRLERGMGRRREAPQTVDSMDSISSELTDRLVSQSQQTLITLWTLTANHIPREAGLSDSHPIGGQDGQGKLSLLWISMAIRQGWTCLMEEGKNGKKSKYVKKKRKKGNLFSVNS